MISILIRLILVSMKICPGQIFNGDHQMPEIRSDVADGEKLSISINKQQSAWMMDADWTASQGFQTGGN